MYKILWDTCRLLGYSNKHSHHKLIYLSLRVLIFQTVQSWITNFVPRQRNSMNERNVARSTEKFAHTLSMQISLVTSSSIYWITFVERNTVDRLMHGTQSSLTNKSEFCCRSRWRESPGPLNLKKAAEFSLNWICWSWSNTRSSRYVAAYRAKQEAHRDRRE